MMLLTTMHCVKTPKRLEQQKIMKKSCKENSSELNLHDHDKNENNIF